MSEESQAPSLNEITVERQIHAPGCGCPHPWSVPEDAYKTEAVCACFPDWNVSEDGGIEGDANPSIEEITPKRNGQVSATLPGRILLGEAIQHGVAPPDEFEPGVLLRGAVHQIFAGPGSGKTWLALHLLNNAIGRGQTVAFFDTENGKRIVGERLGALCVNPSKVDELLFYFPSPSLNMEPTAVESFALFLDETRPELVVFDSWLDHLAGAGLDENSATDIAAWASRYSRPARERGSTVLLLDHVPHDNAHARGSTRKKDEADVQWRLLNTRRFDRETVGEITLRREKDREGWLPPVVKFSVGSGQSGFVFRRSEGTIEEADSGLTDSQEQALQALETFENGATFTQWWRASGLQAKSTFGDAKLYLERNGYAEKRETLYFAMCETSSPKSPTGQPADAAGPPRKLSGLSGGSIGPPDRTYSDRSNSTDGEETF